METTVRDFVRGTAQNAVTNATAHPELLDGFERINRVFLRFADVEAVRARPHAIFFAMCHANYLTSCALALTGQPPPAYMASRGALESSLYFYWCERESKAFATWKERDTDDIARTRARKMFRIAPLMKALDDEHKSIGNQFHIAYENTIDFGAHPNYSALVTNLEEHEGLTKWMAVSCEPIVLSHTCFAISYGGLTALAVILAAAGPKLGKEAASDLLAAWDVLDRFKAVT